MPADRTITEYSVEFHGLQHPDSFQGAGIPGYGLKKIIAKFAGIRHE